MYYLTRRKFLTITALAATSSALPLTGLRANPKYRRYNVASPQGQKMLESYAKGVAAMLKLPADHPQNWFRNAFIHMMDCPHGNWWFYVWHRGYLGYFEQTIRTLSGDDNFAIPYWDWTQSPKIPDGMFDGVLNPTDSAYEAYTGNLALFTKYINTPLQNYWKSLSSAQAGQLKTRGYDQFDKLWNDVTGYNVAQSNGISGNMAYAITCGARYLSRDNAALDGPTSDAVSAHKVRQGLTPPLFNGDSATVSFTSSKSISHNVSFEKPMFFSVLEGFPHNKVHNCIGGVGAVDPGPYGNMTNFLSPVDPIFFLHHSNMDRLWDVWTRRQISLKRPYLPTGKDLAVFSNEPFLFYVDGKGQYVQNSKAGDYLSTSVFDYDYEPGFGEDDVQRPILKQAKGGSKPLLVKGASIKANVLSATVPSDVVKRHLADELEQPMVVEVTIPRPSGYSTLREFDVLINAPAGVTKVDVNSPYYAGTISFFGPTMQGMKMESHATFAVPLPKTLHAFKSLGAAPNVALKVQIVPSQGAAGKAPTLRSMVLKAM